MPVTNTRLCFDMAVIVKCARERKELWGSLAGNATTPPRADPISRICLVHQSTLVRLCCCQISRVAHKTTSYEPIPRFRKGLRWTSIGFKVLCLLVTITLAPSRLVLEPLTSRESLIPGLIDIGTDPHSKTKWNQYNEAAAPTMT